jgi:soluble lytic murein transglycosylase
VTRFATIRSLIVLLAALGGAGPGAQPAGDDAVVRAEFLAAYRAAALGEATAPPSAALSDYVLFDYVEMVRLEHALGLATGAAGDVDRAAEAFIATHEGEPVSRRVVQAWLESLARRGLSTLLVSHFEPEAAGTALECRYLDARIELGHGAAIADAVRELWRNGAQLPPDCEPVFVWGRDHGVIDTAAIADRVAALLENGNTGFARVVAQRLPAASATRFLGWAALIEEPAAEFDRLADDPTASPGIDAVLDAWSRFARNDPSAAAARIEHLVDALDPGSDAVSRLHLALALGLAWDRRPAALAHFAAVGREDLDDYAREWQARAALWSGQWPTAADAIAAMSDATRTDSAWRYWQGRAAAALDDAAGARSAWEAVLGDDNFYAALAAARLGRRHLPAHAPLEVPDAALAELAARPGLARARELHAVGLENDARREWNAVYSALPLAQRRASIRLAADWGWHEIAVLTATRNGVFDDYALLYPQPFTDIVPAAADLTRFDHNLLYALIRQESLFAADAVSSAGAIGLTQLRLETARRAAVRWELAQPTRDALFDPATNVRLGAAQLRNLLDEFDGQLMPALAGYNAGYYAAARWLPDSEIDADIWVENIPYNETRAYVRRVLWHSLVYAWLETGTAQDASGWLAPVRRP